MQTENQEESMGLNLLKKGQKGIVYAVFSRLGIILILFILQVMCMIGIFHWFEGFLPHIFGGTILFTVIMVLYLLNSRMDPTAKITWLTVIMLMPVFGALLYWYTQSDVGHRALKKRINSLLDETKNALSQSEEVKKNIENEKRRN